MRFLPSILTAVALGGACGCASHRAGTFVDVPLPATTPYDGDASARSTYLEGFRSGYRAFVAGRMETPYYEPGHYPDVERRGYWAGITAASEARTGHVEPERRSTEAQIQQHITGEWKLSDKSDGPWYPKMILAEDRTITVIGTNGTRTLLGSWECRDRMLRITPRAELVEAAKVSGDRFNTWDHYPIIYADAHELVMAPGISVAGRLRFTR